MTIAPTVVLITGADSGVGLAISKVLASASPSCHIIMTSRSLPAAQVAQSDVLINNAASGSMGPDSRTRFQLCLETNVTGPALIAQAFRPLLLKSQNPYSVYVSSGAGSLTKNAARKPHPSQEFIKNGDAYSLREYGPKCLKVFVMSPGFVRSNLRGTSEEARSGWGGAEDPVVAGNLVLSIVRGERDADVGRFVHPREVFVRGE